MKKRETYFMRVTHEKTSVTRVKKAHRGTACGTHLSNRPTKKTCANKKRTLTIGHHSPAKYSATLVPLRVSAGTCTRHVSVLAATWQTSCLLSPSGSQLKRKASGSQRRASMHSDLCAFLIEELCAAEGRRRKRLCVAEEREEREERGERGEPARCAMGSHFYGTRSWSKFMVIDHGDRRCAAHRRCARWRTSAIMLAAAAVSMLEAQGAGADLLPANNDRVSLARSGGGGARAYAESCILT